MGELDNKIAVITGGTSGIGKATAELFKKEGAEVICVARLGLTDYPCNVADESSVYRAMKEITKKYERFDILVNNVGKFISAPLLETRNQDLDYMIDVNVKSVVYVSKAILPYMIEQKNGSIVNVASIMGVLGSYNSAGYSASKGAVIALTKSMATDYAEYNIRVNSVSPSLIETPMTKDIPEDVKQRIIDEHLIKRIGQPEDVANAILFLASDKSSWITGLNLPVDGGLSVR